jgi:phosphodiesterase/alkaline phosphatase D-like protein
MALDAPAGNPIVPDQWDGYKAEQQDILDSARRRKVKDIAFLTGDIHTFFAGQVTPSGRQPGQPQPGGPVATEFVGGSITSDGLADSVAREPLKAPAGQAPGRAERLQRARQQPPHRVLEPAVQGLRREVSVFALDASGWVR